ncbi:MAG TPA: hypothetical protein VLC55_14690 [Burkholderiales bacterium]|nr:hypothetical protein [Burkholderiales bacterium]
MGRTPAFSIAEVLNRDCRCVSVDLHALRSEMERDLQRRGLNLTLVESHPHLFSTIPVFVSGAQVRRMAAIIRAVESVVAVHAYREHVLAWAPATARQDPGPLGVFLGYDFHLGADGAQLIEINTNAGGAMLNVVLARAQRACCSEIRALSGGPADVSALEHRLVDMFRSEWRQQRGSAPLRSIAIVDGEPQGQYLYPEFLLFQRLLEGSGMETVIADPRDLRLRQGGLWTNDRRIDLVYNRLTDFGLELAGHGVLRDAWLERAAVVTPHPRAHALYADKRNLAVLTDGELLRGWGVPEQTLALLASGIPRTVLVDPSRAEGLWAERKRLFFKPAAGYGSKGSYRGDKLTRRVFDEILAGCYVAQALVPPTERVTPEGGAPPFLKLDLRNYVYAGEVQLLAARLYQGQTTNFRTAGGGFAPVYYPASDDV